MIVFWVAQIIFIKIKMNDNTISDLVFKQL